MQCNAATAQQEGGCVHASHAAALGLQQLECSLFTSASAARGLSRTGQGVSCAHARMHDHTAGCAAPVVALCVGLPSAAFARASAGEFLTGEYVAHT